jgi:hypothetical protein
MSEPIKPRAGSTRAILLSHLHYFNERRTVSDVMRMLRDNHGKYIGHSGVRAALDRMQADGVLQQTYQWKGSTLRQHWEVATATVTV